MDLTSYLLGKKAGGGGSTPSGGADLSEYFNTTITDGTSQNGIRAAGRIIKKFPTITISDSVTSLNGAFYSQGNFTLKLIGGSNVTNMSSMFNGYAGTDGLDLSELISPNVENVSSMFYNCKSLTHLDIRKMTFDNVTTHTNMFGVNSANGVPDNCEIIVKSDTEKTWITDKFSRLTNVKTVAEYEASQS